MNPENSPSDQDRNDIRKFTRIKHSRDDESGEWREEVLEEVSLPALETLEASECAMFAKQYRQMSLKDALANFNSAIKFFDDDGFVHEEGIGSHERRRRQDQNEYDQTQITQAIKEQVNTHRESFVPLITHILELDGFLRQQVELLKILSELEIADDELVKCAVDRLKRVSPGAIFDDEGDDSSTFQEEQQPLAFAIVSYISSIGEKAIEYVDVLIEAFAHYDSSTFESSAICSAIVKIGWERYDYVAPLLIAGLYSTNNLICLGCINAIGDFGMRSEAAIPDLINCLDDPESSVREAAIVALGKLRGKAAKASSTILNIYNEGGSLRHEAIFALARIGANKEEIIKILENYWNKLKFKSDSDFESDDEELEEINPEYYFKAIAALASYDKRILSIYEEAFSHTSECIRDSAAHEAGYIDDILIAEPYFCKILERNGEQFGNICHSLLYFGEQGMALLQKMLEECKEKERSFESSCIESVLARKDEIVFKISR